MYLLVPSTSQESLILLANVQVPSREEIILKKFDYFEEVINSCGRTSTADPAPGRSFSSRGYRVAVGQCGSLVLHRQGAGELAKS